MQTKTLVCVFSKKNKTKQKKPQSFIIKLSGKKSTKVTSWKEYFGENDSVTRNSVFFLATDAACVHVLVFLFPTWTHPHLHHLRFSNSPPPRVTVVTPNIPPADSNAAERMQCQQNRRPAEPWGVPLFWRGTSVTGRKKKIRWEWVTRSCFAFRIGAE